MTAELAAELAAELEAELERELEVLEVGEGGVVGVWLGGAALEESSERKSLDGGRFPGCFGRPRLGCDRDAPLSSFFSLLPPQSITGTQFHK